MNDLYGGSLDFDLGGMAGFGQAPVRTAQRLELRSLADNDPGFQLVGGLAVDDLGDWDDDERQ